MTDNTRVFNCDCLPAMKEFPDKYFDLAIVDPPYANNLNGGRSAKNGWDEKIDWNKATKGWNVKPDVRYWEELFRVSKNQIVWGGNYFADIFTASSCWIVWDKGQRDFSLADAELAWTSFFDKAVRVKTIHRSVANQQERFHPTQKPVALYKWLLKNYAKEGDKILDTHGGSMSSVIACIDMGFSITCFELDEDYYKLAKLRIQNHVSQLNAFRPKYEIEFHDNTGVSVLRDQQ